MSFTSEVKNQICKDEVDANASKAQLCALFQIRASLHMNWQGMYLSFQSENATIAKHVFQLLKQNYRVDPRLAVLKKMQLKKNNIYRIQVYEKAEAGSYRDPCGGCENMLSESGHLHPPSDER